MEVAFDVEMGKETNDRKIHSEKIPNKKIYYCNVFKFDYSLHC